MAIRIDLGALRSPKRLADGRIVAEGLLTRAGVFVYRNPDGTERRELRPPEEVFRKDSLDSFAMTTVTNEHPPVLLNSKNAKKYAVGSVGENIVRDDEHVRARLTVFDADTIAQMEAGKASLSCGYEVDVDETAGTHPLYGRYDCIQRNVRGNHVAIVATGRAGEAARVRMDAAVMVPGRLDNEGDNMDPEKLAVELGAQTKRADEAEALAKTEKARADAAEGRLQGLQSRVDAGNEDGKELARLRAENEEMTEKLQVSEKARMDAEDPERFRKAVHKRVKILTAAQAMLGDSSRLDEFTDPDLMRAVIEKMPKVFGGGDLPAGATKELVEARFDICVDFYQNGERGKQKLRAVTRADNQSDPRTSRERFIASQRALGTEPLSKREN